jgi:hypothetical protein
MTRRKELLFSVGDWMKDPALRSVSVAARGLWMEMICMMHEAPRMGYLEHANGSQFTTAQVARVAGCSIEEAKSLTEELEQSSVFSRTEDGTIYSRRLVRESTKKNGSRVRAMGSDDKPGFVYAIQDGKGRLRFGKSSCPEKIAYKLRNSLGDSQARVIAKKRVEDLATEGTELLLEVLRDAASFDQEGDWVTIPERRRAEILHTRLDFALAQAKTRRRQGEDEAKDLTALLSSSSLKKNSSSKSKSKSSERREGLGVSSSETVERVLIDEPMMEGGPVFRCIRSPGAPKSEPAPEWRVTQALFESWVEAYPAVDVLAQIKAAAAWCESNPSKRKTKRGMPAFINRWLARTQDRAGPAAGPRRGRGSVRIQKLG